jgi:hypothetical protein
MRRQWVRSGSVLLLAVALVRCSLPTSFDESRDVLITVDDAAPSHLSADRVTVPLDVRILNQGSRTMSYNGPCGLALMNRLNGGSFSISQLCTLLPSQGVEIRPGQEVSVGLTAGALREVWGERIEGEYTLELGLLVEGHNRAQLVASTPFRIEVE